MDDDEKRDHFDPAEIMSETVNKRPIKRANSHNPKLSKKFGMNQSFATTPVSPINTTFRSSISGQNANIS